jgi:type I restriction enzyme, S subunit
VSQLAPGWCSAALRDIGEVRLGRQRSPDRANGPHMRQYMRAANVTWAGISTEDVKEMDFSPEEFEVFALRPGDVLVGEASGSRMEVGKSAIWRGEVPGACFQNTLIRVRASEAVLPEYLQKHLAHDARRGALAEISKGIGIHHLGAAGLAEWQIQLAPLPEQRRIADKLETLLARVDACRERLDRLPAILKRFRQSVLAAATSGELTREWREERGRAVGDWVESTVGDLVQRIEAGFNVQCEERPPRADERGLVKISAVTWGTYDDNESKTLPRGAEVPERSRIRVGDFLLSRANTIELVGACVIVGRVARPVFLSDKVLRLVMLDDWKAWLLFILQSPGGRREIEVRSSGNQLSMRNLAQAKLREIPVRLPPSDERDEIVRLTECFLMLADQIGQRYAASRRVVEHLTPALLAKAFRGELVPQDPTDEPASVLLARIRADREAATKTAKPKAVVARAPRRQLATNDRRRKRNGASRSEQGTVDTRSTPARRAR